MSYYMNYTGAELDDAINKTQYMWFPDRASLVTWAGSNTPEVGAVVSAGGLLYEYDGVSTAISDLTGWKPFGDVYPDHFAENTTPGTTDMTAAIQSAIDYVKNRRAVGVTDPAPSEFSGTVSLDGGYKISSSIVIDADGVVLKGNGRQDYLIRDDGVFDTITIAWNGTTTPVGNFVDNVEVRNIGLYASVPITANAHIKNTAAREIRLKSIHMTDCHVGVETIGSKDFVFDDILIEYDVSNYTASPAAGSAGFIFKRNGTGATNYTSGGLSGRVNDCRVFLRTTPGGAFPVEYNYKVQYADGIWFNNCYGRGAKLGGFAIVPQDTDSRTTGLKLTDCWVDWCDGTSYILGDSSTVNNNKQHQMNSCRVYGGTGPQTQTFIDIQNALNVEINGGIFIESQDAGIKVAGNCYGIILNGITARGCCQSAGFGVVEIADGARNVTISGNQFGYDSDASTTSSSNYGVVISTSIATTNILVSGNDLSGNAVSGYIDNSTGTNTFSANNGTYDLLPGTGPAITPSGGTITVTHEVHEIDNSALGATTLNVASITNNGSGFARIAFSTAHNAVVGDVLTSNTTTGVGGYDVTHYITAIVDGTTVDTTVAYISAVGAVGSFDLDTRIIHRILGGDVGGTVALFQRQSTNDISFHHNITDIYPNDALWTNGANVQLNDTTGIITFRKRTRILDGGKWALDNLNVSALS